jgi:hypothetical protein
MKNIICFLTVKPSKEFYNFTKTFKNKDYDVYIVIDKNGYMIPDYDGYIPIIEVNNYNCESRGYKNTLYYLEHKACARDKALYYFSMTRQQFKHLWLIEEDVFIPNVNIIPTIDTKYPDVDLLCKDNKIISNINQTYEWHWPKAKPYILVPLPWACSLICAVRISPKLLCCIANYAKWYSTLFLDEALFNTLAVHNKLSIKKIDELSRLEFDKKWNINEISENYLYHPIKNFKDHQFLRQYIANKNLSNSTINNNSVNTNDYSSEPEIITKDIPPNLDNNNFLSMNFTNTSNNSNTSNNTTEVRQLELRLAKAIETRTAIEKEIAELKDKLYKML